MADMAEPLTQPGWYRLTEHGIWQTVSDGQALAEVAAGAGWDLVHVGTTAAEEITLF